MEGFLASVSSVLSSVGTAIWDTFKSIGNFISGTFSTVLDFFSKIPEYISSGFDWVKKGITSIFSGDSAGTQEAAQQGMGEVANDTSRVSSEIGNTSISQAGRTAQVVPDVAPSATQVARSSGGLGIPGGNVAQAASASAGAGGSDWMGTMGDFFKTDIGKLVGTTGMMAAKYYTSQQQSKNQMKMMESMQRRQAQQNRQDWLLQEQRQSQLASWQAQRQNEIAKATEQNKWSGFTGKWVDPTTAVPIPNA